MLDMKVLATGEDVNLAFKDFAFDRGQAVKSWIDYLLTHPPARDVTTELMGTQAIFRQAHDLITGRVTLGDVAEEAL